jgi:hypothetical protein
VWVENRSSQAVVFFVDDLGSDPAPYYVVPANTAARVGTPGLSTRDVRVNVLGWRHEANGVGPCAPGDYDDTIYDVPPDGGVRLLIEASGQPSVAMQVEPASLRLLERAPLDAPLTEDELCERVQELVVTQPAAT